MTKRPRSRLLLAGIAVALLAGFVLNVGAPVDAANKAARTHDFPDVADDNVFHDDIHWMVDQGFMGGYADDLFHPADSLTRQAVVQILWKMSDSPAGPFPPEPFTDVGPGSQFHTAISWAYSTGVIGGFADGTFRPMRSISRQALGAMLHDLSGIERLYGSVTFSDVPASNPFALDIRWWVASGQADGYGDGTFHPTEAVTRQAAARFFFHYYDMMGGFWPHIDHHEHVCEVTPTAEQIAASDVLLAAAKVQVPALFPNKGAALAAGYRVNAPGFSGVGSHMVNDTYTQDGIALDPTKPESLVLLDTPGPENNSTPVGAEMFVREYVGTGPVWPPEPGGCRTLWHGHDNLCFNRGLLEGGSVVFLSTFPGGCIGSSMVRITPEMLHVWVDVGHADDPFAGVET